MIKANINFGKFYLTAKPVGYRRVTAGTFSSSIQLSCTPMVLRIYHPTEIELDAVALNDLNLVLAHDPHVNVKKNNVGDIKIYDSADNLIVTVLIDSIAIHR